MNVYVSGLSNQIPRRTNWPRPHYTSHTGIITLDNANWMDSQWTTFDLLPPGITNRRDVPPPTPPCSVQWGLTSILHPHNRCLWLGKRGPIKDQRTCGTSVQINQMQTKKHWKMSFWLSCLFGTPGGNIRINNTCFTRTSVFIYTDQVYFDKEQTYCII